MGQAPLLFEVVPLEPFEALARGAGFEARVEEDEHIGRCAAMPEIRDEGMFLRDLADLNAERVKGEGQGCLACSARPDDEQPGR